MIELAKQKIMGYVCPWNIVVRETGSPQADAAAREALKCLMRTTRKIEAELATSECSKDRSYAWKLRTRLRCIEEHATCAVTLGKERVQVCVRYLHTSDEQTHLLLHELAHVICDDIGHTDAFEACEERVREVAAKPVSMWLSRTALYPLRPRR